MSEVTKKKPFEELRVLYVEDEEFVRDTMEGVLKRSIGHVTIKSNGEEAWEAFAEAPFDAIITDVNMPYMDGLELAQKVKEKSPSTPIIITTAYSDTDHLIDAINVGIDFFLTKPVSLDKLKKILEKIQTQLEAKNQVEKTNKLLNEYKKAVDASAILTISDLEGNITYANDKVCEISGYAKEELLGQPHSIFRHPDMSGAVFQDLWETILAKKIWKGIIKNKRKSGIPYYVDSTIVPVLDASENITQFLGIRYDVTDLIEKEMALQEAVKKAQAADKAKSEFLANMSHEIRTPMNGIIGFLDILRGTNPSEKQLEYIDIVKTSSNHLLEIINDILDISKIESGKLALELLPVDICSEIKGSAILYQGRANEKNITLRYDIDENITKILLADAVRLRQVFSNLISNAVKFTESGDVSISVRKIASDAASETILFRVEDSGIGIPKDKLHVIFSPFEQADASVTRKYGGTGLGLAICKRLVEMMGGELSAESEMGKGSKFSFELTFKKGDGVSHQTGREERGVSQDVRFDAKILVAEDNKINQKLIKIMLEHLGVKCVLAEDGKEAFEALCKEAFDLILMDVNMPVLDGISATKMIKSYEKEHARRSVPIIALTANALSGDREKFLNEGMDGYLPKPIDKDMLVRILDEFLGEKKTIAKELSRERVENSLEALLSVLNEELGLDASMSKELLGEFFTDIDKELRELEEAILARESERIASIAHSIKGASLNLRLSSVGCIAKEIEEKAREGMCDVCDTLFSTLIEAINEYKLELIERGEENG